jgi:hypothetical protein
MSDARTRANGLAAGAAASSVLSTLTAERTIGSTVIPAINQGNPYGLDVAKISSGKILAGDLIVCNFNNSANTQGEGTSMVALRPIIGSSPRLITNTAALRGCNALLAAPTGPIWAADWTENINPIFNANGGFITGLNQEHWHHPFGEAFAPPVNQNSDPAFYVSNAGDGSLVRVYVLAGPTFKFTTIVTGFPINNGLPGGILGPSGLNYQRAGDRLYVVDGTNNALYAIDNVSRIAAGGIVVHGTAFSGSQAGAAHLIYKGSPLNGPVSSAVLFNGNIVLGNTLDPDGKNLMVEISPSGALLHISNVDTGAAGAIFGMVATGTSASTTRLYFNDDNDNTVKVLEP